MEDIMNRSLLLTMPVVCAFLFVSAMAEEVGAPVVIDPSIRNFSGLFPQKLSKMFFIGEVIDKRKNVASDTVGATRTGRFTVSPILCKTLPTAILINSLTGMFRERGALADEKNGADFQIDAELLDYTLEETNKVFSQQIKATVKFRVKVRTAGSGSLVNQFVIKAEDARSAVDTTPFAVKVGENAMISALQNLLESLVTLK
jgi:hypothetical protein